MERFLVLFTIGVFALAAQTPEPQTTAPGQPATERPVMRGIPDPSAPGRVGVSITQRKLALSEAIEMALANNLDIEIERTNRASAEQNALAARGFFDPAFRWTPLFETRNTPVASVFQGAGGKLTEGFQNSSLSLRQRFPKWGTQGRIDFVNYRQTTTNPFTNFNPAITSQLVIAVTQPIFRGLRIDRERAEIKIRQKRVDLAGVDLENRAIDVITRTQQAYYDLVAAREAVAVSQDLVALGREQLGLNERLVKAGTLAPIEISAAEAELQRRIDTLYSNLGMLTEVENALKVLIAPERSASIWVDELIPTDMEPLKPATDDLREAVETAVKRRPEMRSLDVQTGINQVEQELQSDLRKPEISFVGQYALSGLAGSLSAVTNPFTNLNAALNARVNDLSVANGMQPLPAGPSFGSVPDFLVGGYGNSLSNMFTGRYQSFQVGAQIDFNIRNRAADANYANSLITAKRIKLERARSEQAIQAQVRNALQGIETARQRIQAAEASARAAKEKLDSEIRLYQTGESTNFLVLTRQNEYADSRRRSVVAHLDYNKSVTLLEQALGTTLSAHNISVQ
jgi:HAE1 family hydrophobic/amphiphilic exporter-1